MANGVPVIVSTACTVIKSRLIALKKTMTPLISRPTACAVFKNRLRAAIKNDCPNKAYASGASTSSVKTLENTAYAIPYGVYGSRRTGSDYYPPAPPRLNYQISPVTSFRSHALHGILKAVFRVDDLRRMFAASADHAQGVARVRLHFDQFAVVEADLHPATSGADAANDFFPFHDHLLVQLCGRWLRP